jgi:hypothetical protein
MKFKPTYSDKQREAQKRKKEEELHPREVPAESDMKKTGGEHQEQDNPQAPKSKNAA